MTTATTTRTVCPSWCQTDHNDGSPEHRTGPLSVVPMLPAGQLAGRTMPEWVELMVEARDGNDEDPRMHAPHLVLELDTDELAQAHLSPEQALALANALIAAAERAVQAGVDA